MKSKLRFRDGPTGRIYEVAPKDIKKLRKRHDGTTFVELNEGTFLLAVEPDFDTLRDLLDSLRKKETKMKFKQYLNLIADRKGFFPTPHLQWVIHKNPRKTAREEAIAAEIIEQANPRENITGHFPWGPEQQMVLQQLWIWEKDGQWREEWRDVPTKGASDLFSVEETESGELPVPNAVKEPGQVRADFMDRIKEALGEEE